MPANAPKVLLRSEQSGGALPVVELTGSAAPPEAAKPIPDVVALGPPIGERQQT